MNTKIYNMPNDEYHALDSASSSRLKMARKSIAHMLAPREGRAAFDLGTAIHSLVLEGADAFAEQVVSRPEQWSDWRTKAAREWRDEQQAAGRTVISDEEGALVRRLADKVMDHDGARALLERSTGQREVSYMWHDEEFDVPCRARFDALAIDGGQFLAVDLKSTRSAHPDDFARSCIQFGYDLQLAHYSAGFEAVEGEELAAWTIIAVETQEPYGVAVYTLGSEWLYRGMCERRFAMERFAEWWHAGKPRNVKPYPETIETIEMPRWA